MTVSVVSPMWLLLLRLLSPVPSFPLSSLSPQISKRHRTVPVHLKDFHCYAVDDPSYQSSSELSYSKISSHHLAYINNITNIPIPTSYAEVRKSKEWTASKELDAMEENNTWDVVSLPKGKNAIGCRWLHTLKFNADGTLERRKSRLVAKGYTQKESLDYNEIFYPVTKMATIKLLLKISASKQWFLLQLDISNAFLNGDLEEEIYI